MAYNPYFPMNYQQPYMPQYQPQQNNMVCEWVQGEASAAAMPNPPVGGTGIYMDVSKPYVYKKETGLDGKPLPIEKFRLVKEDEQEKPKVDLKEYIKREEIEDIITDKLNEVVRDEVDRRLSEFTFKPNNRRKNSED